MNWMDQLAKLDMHTILEWLDRYESLGPLPGILLPFTESFLPFLPLIVFVVANASAYGPLEGFLYSWIGAIGGSACMFWLSRWLGRKFNPYLHRRMPKIARALEWIEQRGFTPIFLLTCFPFTPSFLITLVSGISTIPFRRFLLAVMGGKAVMLFCLSVLGYDLNALVQEPWRMALALALIAAMWFAGKRLEARYKL
jgi:uncharacterized membrane protein YdjX (TVP38/TMEM64 family)